MIIRVNPHSLVDLITNSSTEIFVVNTDKTVEVVREMIDEIQGKYPNEYGHRLHVGIADPWQLNDFFGIYDLEDAKRYLEANGYEVTKKDEAISYITISAERGGLASEVHNFINDNFEVVHYDFDH